jgi:hypothetical protein
MSFLRSSKPQNRDLPRIGIEITLSDRLSGFGAFFSELDRVLP